MAATDMNGNGTGLSAWGWRVAGILFGGIVALGGVWIAHPMSSDDVHRIVRDEVPQLIAPIRERLDRGDQDRLRAESKIDEIGKIVQRLETSQAEMNGSLKTFLGRVDARH